MDSLNETRKVINDLDREMAELFCQRMLAVREVAKFKQERGLPILDPAREAEVIEKNSMLVEDEEIRSYYVKFIESVMSVSRAYQDRLISGMKIAYCGTEGAFAHIAAESAFPHARKLAYDDFIGAYRAVEDGIADIAVLPIENSYNGEVSQVTDLMFSGSLYINSVFELAVTHDLLATPGATLDSIEEVISHPQALAQCAEFLRDHNLKTRDYSNTALAARLVSELKNPTVAAIASEEAAKIFGLSVLERNINSSRQNTTRFAVFSRVQNSRSLDKMGVHSIFLFTVPDKAGALAKAIDIIGKHGFNMITLRSRPMKQLLWRYYFYVEAEGNIYSDEGQAMLRELREHCHKLNAVGTYTKD